MKCLYFYIKVLDLKIITMGDDAEKKELAEEILFAVWQTALKSTESTAPVEEQNGDLGDTFPQVAAEVRKILNDIPSKKGVQKLSVEKACILLHVACKTPHAMLNAILYFESRIFHDRMSTIAEELGYQFNTAFAFYAFLQIDNLWGVTNQMSKLFLYNMNDIDFYINITN